MKKIYESPEVELIEVQIEKGFAGSNPNPHSGPFENPLGGGDAPIGW